jgi:hypothetical protein
MLGRSYSTVLIESAASKSAPFKTEGKTTRRRKTVQRTAAIGNVIAWIQFETYLDNDGLRIICGCTIERELSCYSAKEPRKDI